VTWVTRRSYFRQSAFACNPDVATQTYDLADHAVVPASYPAKACRVLCTQHTDRRVFFANSSGIQQGDGLRASPFRTGPAMVETEPRTLLAAFAVGSCRPRPLLGAYHPNSPDHAQGDCSFRKG